MECSGKGLILLEATLWELQELDCALLSFFVCLFVWLAFGNSGPFPSPWRVLNEGLGLEGILPCDAELWFKLLLHWVLLLTEVLKPDSLELVTWNYPYGVCRAYRASPKEVGIFYLAYEGWIKVCLVLEINSGLVLWFSWERQDL